LVALVLSNSALLTDALGLRLRRAHRAETRTLGICNGL